MAESFFLLLERTTTVGKIGLLLMVWEVLNASGAHAIS
jgi:hypothetical protein